MFGYVRIAKPELKMGDYDRYQGVYCSLCRRLGKRYGLLVRCTLSYDFTCLALLGMALSEDCVGFRRGRCPYHPLRRRLCCSDTTYIDYAADAAMLLLWYQLSDTLEDGGFWERLGARLFRLAVRRSYRKAAALRPAWDAAIAEEMRRQVQCERQFTSLDAAADPTARMLALLARDLSDDPRQRRVLDRLGYCLGRYVYLTDDLDDWEEDRRRGRFNPYERAHPELLREDPSGQSLRAYAQEALQATIAELRRAYELLDVRRFDGILRNIWEQGMPLTVVWAATDRKERRRQYEGSV